MFEEHCDESFIACPLPDEAIRDAAVRLDAEAVRHEIIEGGWRSAYQVRPPIEHADIDEPRHRVQSIVSAVGGNRRGEEVLSRWTESIERSDPARGGEFGRPDHVQLEDVRIGCPAVQPLDVQLKPLSGRTRRRLDVDRYARVRRRESLDLAPEHDSFGAQRTAGYGEDVGTRSACGGRPQPGRGYEPGRQSHGWLG